MRIAFAGKTDVGMQRDHNEDAFALVETEGLAIVADGMGGHEAGEVAARLAVEEIARFFREGRVAADDESFVPDPARTPPEDQLLRAIHAANRRIRAEGELAAQPRYRAMGTTLVAAVLQDGSITIAHVGDSRAYCIRGGTLTPLTRDHSFLEQFRLAHPAMTEAEERDFPHKNVITRALGMTPEVEPDVCTEPVRPGDRFLLCTDGLTGMITPAAIASILTPDRPLAAILDDLVDRANRAGGTDNITAVLIDCSSDPAE